MLCAITFPVEVFFQSKSDRYHRINSPAGTLIFSKRTKCYVVSHYFILIFFLVD